MTANELLEDYPDRKIMVFDSLNASLGEGVSVYRAVELWKEGKSMEEVYDILMEERDHVNVSFTVNDLYHLQRGGRVSKTTAVVGSLVNIKPILVVTSTGELKSDGTVRGRKKSLKTLVGQAGRVAGSGFLRKGQDGGSPARRLSGRGRNSS